MLYIQSFRNYEEFKELFGIREFEGNKSRKNKILLSLLKDKGIHRKAVETGDLTLLSIRNMADLKNTVIEKVRESGKKNSNLYLQVTLLGIDYYNDQFLLDELDGICTDETANAIRYINSESGRVYKMKAGKFMRHLIVSTEFGNALPESVINWVCEEFSRSWESHSLRRMPKTKLYVNDSFEDIYSSGRLLGYDCCDDCFGSCMVDENLHSFYEDSVKAKAAYLENEDGMIIARCIIFTEVFDEQGTVWRYAERQYSYEGREVYKLMLIEKLIEEGHIDCYKQIGACCADATAILDVNGKSLSGKRFKIACHIDADSCVSYQDTFKAYDHNTKEAYNYGFDSCSDSEGRYNLDITEGYIDFYEESQFDSYHERNAHVVVPCSYHGRLGTVDADDTCDFILYNGEYYHADDLIECTNCGDYMLNPAYYDDEDEGTGIFYSDMTREYYCCESCRDGAEKEYRQGTESDSEEKAEHPCEVGVLECA